jgi:integral membrane protein
VSSTNSTSTSTSKPYYAGALLRYRIMAYVTGVALVTACVFLILQKSGVKGIGGATYDAWEAHGWLFLLYAVTTLNLGIRVRWPLTRYVWVGLAGMVPFVPFFAERYVSRSIHEHPPVGRTAAPAEVATDRSA